MNMDEVQLLGRLYGFTAPATPIAVAGFDRRHVVGRFRQPTAPRLVAGLLDAAPLHRA